MRTKVFKMAWQFVKKNGYTLSEALKAAWANIKLVKQMSTKIVKFYFRKVDGSIREAYGTLKAELLPATQGTGRKPSELVQVYFDTERGEFRSYKKANLITMAYG